MKRCVFKIGLFCLAGAIMNVAVAWWCAAFIQPWASDAGTRTFVVDQAQSKWWDDHRPVRFGERARVASRMELMGFAAEHVSAERQGVVVIKDETGLVSGLRHSNQQKPPFFDHALRVHAGFPALALQGCEWIEGVGQFDAIDAASCFRTIPAAGSSIRQNVISFDRNGRHRLLPTAVMPIGFAINTSFYAAILWMMVAGAGVLRRKQRLRRGRCAACGYSLRKNVSERCPECGVTAFQYRDRQGAAT
jgi:hypothetical protein